MPEIEEKVKRVYKYCPRIPQGLEFDENGEAVYGDFIYKRIGNLLSVRARPDRLSKMKYNARGAIGESEGKESGPVPPTAGV
jgi:hypothetical protein